MDEQLIAKQILAACHKSQARFSRAMTHGEKQKAALAEFLSGANQVASFLIRADGAVTPQQIERALLIVGKEHGFTLDAP